MIKNALLILTIIVFTNTITFKNFNDIRDACFWVKLGNVFEPINTQDIPLSDEQLECAQDYEKSNVCFYGYNQCFPKDSQSKQTEEMPLVCWNCYMQSPSKCYKYSLFRTCLAEASESLLILSTALVLIMLLSIL